MLRRVQQSAGKPGISYEQSDKKFKLKYKLIQFQNHYCEFRYIP